jgi:asparagine synthetase B (glutamine-hydrolysing)
MVSDPASAPRFNVGDQVVYIGTGFRNGHLGKVVAVGKGFDTVYGYYVYFADGTQGCFGHELQLHWAETQNAA